MHPKATQIRMCTSQDPQVMSLRSTTTSPYLSMFPHQAGLMERCHAALCVSDNFHPALQTNVYNFALHLDVMKAAQIPPAEDEDTKQPGYSMNTIIKATRGSEKGPKAGNKTSRGPQSYSSTAWLTVIADCITQPQCHVAQQPPREKKVKIAGFDSTSFPKSSGSS